MTGRHRSYYNNNNNNNNNINNNININNNYTKIVAIPRFEIKQSMDLCNLYIKGIQFGISSSELFNLFKPFGRIISAKVMQQDKEKRGFGFVSFSKSVEAALAMISMNTKDMVVRFHEPKVPRKEHDFDQQLAFLINSELAMHFYTRPLHNDNNNNDNNNNNKMIPLSRSYMPAIPIPSTYFYYPSPYYHQQGMIYATTTNNIYSPQLINQDQIIKVRLLDMLKYVKKDMSSQEKDIVQQAISGKK
ncbi:hypothetical protein INT46_006860 [Mucor plumbeus]|uniref:RRM domain-containing protein n=1 Tax=Mucor plumbeus TaxID=97098 RepID=A0A8H7RHW6_9FUNG|nr:hypothetical protein INT46_006860 [Mucor plumbeus]